MSKKEPQMSKNKSSIVRVPRAAEVLPPDREQEAEKFKRMVANLIDKRVSEAMTGAGAIFQPWFQPREVAYEIKRNMTVTEQQVWSNYFKQYGCIVCSPYAQTYGTTIALDKEKIAELRKQGLSWHAISKKLGVGFKTLYRFRDGDLSRRAGREHVERPDASEITNGPGHRSLSLCANCYQRIANRREGVLRETAPARDGRTQLNFMDSVRLAREALAPAAEALALSTKKKARRGK
jgi:hypothetical protein